MPLSTLIDRWLPSRCELCGKPTRNRPGLCLTCEHTLPFVDPVKHCRYCASARGTPCPLCSYERPPISRLRSLCHYRSPLDMWVPRLKFHNELALARLLGALFADNVILPGEKLPHALIPLPLHRQRLGERGFDQPLEVCRPIAEKTDIPLRPELLSRRKSTRRQSEMDMEHRQGNLLGAFSVNLPSHGATLPDYVAIFDDVYTTGATINEAAWCLRAAGVTRIEAWVIAHAD